MNILTRSLHSIFDLLFPRDIRVSVFDSLPKTELERCAQQIFFMMRVSVWLHFPTKSHSYVMQYRR
ncbi:MAG: hypothetical protein UU98_C0015G0002 [Parcubacteria group bacterium GW2011_GWD2_42_14]|nr:MAG: hypothetical protein UU98_C0015G0002 [Parcubacteria group bacterium GW2011_GWD2_42_14]